MYAVLYAVFSIQFYFRHLAQHLIYSRWSVQLVGCGVFTFNIVFFGHHNIPVQSNEIKVTCSGLLETAY